MVRLITLNVNGIRSAAKKGFFSWLSKQNADVICLQEVRADLSHLNDQIFHPAGFHTYYFAAEKKGYSGVALYSRLKPKRIQEGLGFDLADKEARYLQADFDNISVASLYLPSGTSGEERQTAKFDFMLRYDAILQQQLTESRDYILCGDWNIAHQKIDIKNWQSNQKSSGFLPEERAWLDRLFGTLGLVDAFRVLNQEPHQYTWWSQRARARENNVGWRIDYQIVTPKLASTIQAVSIYKSEIFSDHAALIVDYNITL